MNDPRGIDDLSLLEGSVATDKRLFAPQEPEQEHWSELFKHDLYDWDDPEFAIKNCGVYAWRRIDLTQGYFMIVSVHDYERMAQFPDGSQKKWHVKLHRDRDTGEVIGAYGRRKGHRGLGEPEIVMAHRELLNSMNSPDVIDHYNGWGLDNRRGTPKEPINLKCVGRRQNNHNATRKRKYGDDLPGVERRGERFGGKVCKRVGKSKKVITIRSKRTWTTQEPANRWFRNQLKKLCRGRKIWAHDPTSVKWPAFPPRLDSEISSRSKKLRRGAVPNQPSEDIPF